MVIQFTPLTKDNSIKDSTELLNNIGSELTKSNNIFQQVDSISKMMQNIQQYSITTKDGYARVPGAIKLIRDLREAGFYYISATALARLTDKPDTVNSDVVVNVIPTANGESCIQYLHTLRSSVNPIALFRYTTANTSSDWMSINTTALGKNFTLTGQDLAVDFIDPGNYYFYNLKNAPTDVNKGFINVSRGDTDVVLFEIRDTIKGTQYTAVRSPDTGLSSWVKATTPQSISDYTLGAITEDYNYQRFGLYVYKSDNISFTQAIEKKLRETNQGSFTFYVQSGVPDSPYPGSIRGLFISDTPKESSSSALHGVYYAITTAGKLVTGALATDSWSAPKLMPSADVLWTGNKLFTDTKKTETLSSSISNYDYVEIYVKPRVTTNSSGDTWDVVNNICHKFYLGSDDFFIVSGCTVDSKASSVGVDYYRVDIRFNGTTFKVDGAGITNKKPHYVTRIVGYRL